MKKLFYSFIVLIAIGVLYFQTDWKSRVADAAQPAFHTYQGGTGTTTIPQLGQILIGDGTGQYGVYSTSSLGISGGGTTFITVCSSGCDYTTTGTNDEVGINNAITAASAAAGTNGQATVLIKAGNYNQQSARIQLKSNVRLLCDGANITVATTTSSSSLFTSGVNNASVTGCTFNDPTPDGAFGITSYRMFEIGNSHNILIDNNKLTNSSGYDIFVYSGAANTSSDITISNNLLTANGHQDIIGGGPTVQGNSTTSNVTVFNNTLIHTVGSGTLNSTVDANCFDMVAVLGINVTENHCYGRMVFGTEKYPNANSIIHHNFLYAAQGINSISGMIVVSGTDASATTTSQGIQITNNTLFSGTIYVTGSSATSPLRNLLVTQNTIYNSPSNYQNENKSGIYATNIIDGIISQNIVVATDTAQTGISLPAATSTTVSLNTIRNFSVGVSLNNQTSNSSIFNTFDNVTTPDNDASIIQMTNGNVGIGTSTPSSTLVVSGSTQITGNLGIGTAPTAPLIISADASNLYAGSLVLDDNLAVAAGIGGRMSFGGNYTGTSPTTWATIAGLKTDGTDGHYGGYLAFSTRPDGGAITEYMRILETGKVGIGTITPTTTLFIQGKGGTNPFVIASSTGSALFTVAQNGNVGISSSTPNYQLSVNGTVAFPGLTTSAGLQTGVVCVGAGGQIINDSVACLASARRYKTNIQNLTVGLEEVLKFQPVSFNWTKEFNRGFEQDPNKNGIQYSLIADDVQTIDPHMATIETSGENKGLVHGLADINHWIALFVQAFKDMQKEIATIQFRQNTQDTKIQELEQKLNKQQAQIIKQQQQINLLLK